MIPFLKIYIYENDINDYVTILIVVISKEIRQGNKEKICLVELSKATMRWQNQDYIDNNE